MCGRATNKSPTVYYNLPEDRVPYLHRPGKEQSNMTFGERTRNELANGVNRLNVSPAVLEILNQPSTLLIPVVKEVAR